MSEPARDPTTDPDRRAFFEIPPESHFPIQNLPYGVFRRKGVGGVHVGVAIGDYVLDLTILEALDLFTDPAIRDTRPFGTRSLNPFMSLGSGVWRMARETISDLLAGINPTLATNTSLQEQALVPQDEVTLLMPVAVGDYTDFYSSREHAVNVGTMFRGAENALMPNWPHLPVAYHGRASSVVVSGTPVARPQNSHSKSPYSTRVSGASIATLTTPAPSPVRGNQASRRAVARGPASAAERGATGRTGATGDQLRLLRAGLGPLRHRAGQPDDRRPPRLGHLPPLPALRP